VTASPRLRPAVRVVLLDPEDRVLLVRWAFPDRDVWGTPGGGLDPGESPEDAVRRELLEETGLDVSPRDVGECVAHRTHVLPMENGYGDRWDGQEEWFYVVRTEAFDPRGTLSDEELRAESLHELRWCDVAAIRELADETAARPVLTAPRALADLVETLRREGPPSVVLELDV
jgi:8-oxo-dGTP pyrophosphatase MutT (NUDIX family)